MLWVAGGAGVGATRGAGAGAGGGVATVGVAGCTATDVGSAVAAGAVTWTVFDRTDDGDEPLDEGALVVLARAAARARLAAARNPAVRLEAVALTFCAVLVSAETLR